MDGNYENLQHDEYNLTAPRSIDDHFIPDIGSNVVIGEKQADGAYDSPLKIWTGKRALCSFSANNSFVDEYPFNAVTYGEPGELDGLPYNDHNYTKTCEDESNNDNQLALLAKVALARKESKIDIQMSDFVPEVISSSAYQSSNSAHVTIIKTPFSNQNYQTPFAIHPTLSGTTCKVATSNGKTLLLKPNRGNLGASVQIHRVSSVNAPNVILRTGLTSAGEITSFNDTLNSVGVNIRCICGFNRDDGCLVQCTNCKIFQHNECMNTSNGVLCNPYLCELCQPRPVMVGDTLGLQRRKIAIANNSATLASATIRLTNPAAAFRLPRPNVHATPQVPNSTVTTNRYFLTGVSSGQSTAPTSLSVRSIKLRFGEVVRPSSTGATLYQVNSTSMNQFSPRFINMDTAVVRPQPQSYMMPAGNQRSSKRKQDLFTLAGESAPTFDNTARGYSYEETAIINGQHMPVPVSNDHDNALGCNDGNDLPGPKFYRAPSQAVRSLSNLDIDEVAKPQPTESLTTTFGEAISDVAAVTTMWSSVPEPASPDVVIWSDSYEKAAETRLSDALKQRIRNIFLNPSESELKTLQMADSFALSRGQQRCRITSFELGRKGLIATECIFPNQPIIEYKGHAMLMDEYAHLHDYKRQFNPFALFYKQLDKAVICLDASNFGNEARFIRRSCMPNCEVRLMFPPTDSFSSVVNPQCIQFVITSSSSRVIPAGTELTVAFDFDYTECHYAVRCACGRGAPLCMVADCFRRQRHLGSIHRHRDRSNLAEGHRHISGDDQEEDGNEFGDEIEAVTCGYDYDPLSHRNQLHSFVEKTSRNRIALKRLLNPKRVSPAFSRVPYPSAKHMVQEQHRRHQNGLSGALTLSKRRSGVRGSGCGRGGGLTRQQHLRASRPRGRPPSSFKRHPVYRPSPLFASWQRHHSGANEEEEQRDENSDLHHHTSPALSSARLGVTEPGATSPRFYSTCLPTTELRVHRFENADINKQSPVRKEQKLRQRQSSKAHAPRRTRQRSSIDPSSGPPTSRISSPNGDSVFTERAADESKSSMSVMTKIKCFRKMGGRSSNGVANSPGLSAKGGSSAAKRIRHQSYPEACDPSNEQQEEGDRTNEKSSSRSCKSREDNWFAEVMRRIERMEKKREKNSTQKKSKQKKVGDELRKLGPRLQFTKPLTTDKPIDAEQINAKDEETPKPNEEALKEESSTASKKSIRKPAPCPPTRLHSSSTPLSREDRWMQWQIQRIAEMESSDFPSSDQPRQPIDGSSFKQRRRASTGAKSYLAHLSPQKTEASDDGAGGAEDNAECSLIVYKHREQDPMAKFSRSRTGHHHQQSSFLNRSYSMVESFVDEDLPAGGELLDDHTSAGENGTSIINDDVPPNAVPSASTSSPLKPSKKRWLSQALMEEDQQHKKSRMTPSPQDSLTPPDSAFNPLNFQNQRALNPKKRIISQLEEAMAQQRLFFSPPDSPEGASPSSEVFTTTSKLPLKKRQSEEDVIIDENVAETPRSPKPEKVRMSLSEYRRRRGLSTASVESTGSSKAQSPPQIAPPVSPKTSPDSPAVDLRRLTLPLLPLTPPASGPPIGGPRTPSESPSDEDEGHKEVVSAPKPSAVSANLPQQLISLPAPVSLSSPMNEVAKRFHNSFDSNSPDKTCASPPLHCPPGSCDRHLSSHAQRCASPPPSPHLGPVSDSSTPLVPPNTSHPPPVEHVVLRDREILQWQMERKHPHFQQSAMRRQQTSPNLSSSAAYRRGNRQCSSSTSTPPQPLASRSHVYPDLIQSLAPASPTTAFNHHDMDSIQETLRRKQEYLRAQLHDLKRAAASGGG